MLIGLWIVIRLVRHRRAAAPEAVAAAEKAVVAEPEEIEESEEPELSDAEIEAELLAEEEAPGEAAVEEVAAEPEREPQPVAGPKKAESIEDVADAVEEELEIVLDSDGEIEAIDAFESAGAAAEEIEEIEVVPVPAKRKKGVEEEPEPKLSLFARLRRGLSKTAGGLVGRIDKLISGRKIDADFFAELEEILFTADLGPMTAEKLLTALETRAREEKIQDAAAIRDILKDEIRKILEPHQRPLEFDAAKPYVIMVVGVNGVGKTTTIGKLAKMITTSGKTVIMGAADTFRAAADEQLTIWAERVGADIVRQKAGSDPAAVAFDSVQAAVNRSVDVVIVDTAGRLHTKHNLMEELKKVKRVMAKVQPEEPHEVLLILDANTGQNAISQAKSFHESLGLTGIILTKLDGTAKGGCIVGICDELAVPVRYIGIGERMDDLRPFEARDFVEALFETAED
ncbi:MAG: signal recognition particle-docking protein FtsY [Myxococcales bacterium]|nr:signal recognition particle-docking protein FtsY [Myxococcales bacterium]